MPDEPVTELPPKIFSALEDKLSDSGADYVHIAIERAEAIDDYVLSITSRVIRFQFRTAPEHLEAIRQMCAKTLAQYKKDGGVLTNNHNAVITDHHSDSKKGN